MPKFSLGIFTLISNNVYHYLTLAGDSQFLFFFVLFYIYLLFGDIDDFTDSHTDIVITKDLFEYLDLPISGAVRRPTFDDT
jgi:hypothetical protein